MKRFSMLTAAVAVVTTVSALALAGGATAASLPTVNITVSGTKQISISGSLVSGAVNIVATHAGQGSGAYSLVQLNPNEPASEATAQGFEAIGAHHGDPNALTAVGDPIMVSADAPSTTQAVLTPGNWLAVNTSGQGAGGYVPFTVATSSAPAALPAPAATLTAIEFGFRGTKVLHNGTVVRSINAGFLVHMNDLIGVKSKAAGKTVIAGLLAGKGPRALHKYLTGVLVDLMDPASPGAVQEQTLNAKPGYYVEACFMNTEDGRDHTQLGMERLVRVKG